MRYETARAQRCSHSSEDMQFMRSIGIAGKIFNSLGTAMDPVMGVEVAAQRRCEVS